MIWQRSVVAEARLKSENLYKVELYLLKIMPMVIALAYLVNTVSSYFRRDSMEHDGFMSLEDRNYPRRHEDDGFMDVFDSRSNRFGDRFRDSGMRGNDMDRIIKYMRHSMNDGEHFTESEAMDLVSDMYHTEGGRKYSGEKFDIHKAKEICERYRGVIPVSATPTDVYVAINS